MVATLAALALCCGPALAAKTPAPRTPSASTEPPEQVTFTTANLYADVNPQGSPTSFYFELGLTTAFTANTVVQSAGEGRTSVRLATPVTGLTPNTTYYYRVVALNAQGQTLGSIKRFMTPRVPLGVAFTNVQDPVPYGAPLTVQGALTGSEAGNHEVILEANPYPYTGGFQQVGNPLITGPTGTFNFTDPGLSVNTQLRVVSVGGSAISSPVLNEEVAVLVSLHAQRTHRRGYMRLYGNVFPAEQGFPVGFQVMRHGDWVSVGGTSSLTGGGAHYSAVIHVGRRGRYRSVVEVRGERTYGYSNQVRIR
jgi:hypothetical protein